MCKLQEEFQDRKGLKLRPWQEEVVTGLDSRGWLGGVSDLKLGVGWTGTEAQAGGFVWVMGC